MTTATVNRPFEVVAATAAYAAVLMVFKQIDEKKGRDEGKKYTYIVECQEYNVATVKWAST